MKINKKFAAIAVIITAVVAAIAGLAIFAGSADRGSTDPGSNPPVSTSTPSATSSTDWYAAGVHFAKNYGAQYLHPAPGTDAGQTVCPQSLQVQNQAGEQYPDSSNSTGTAQWVSGCETTIDALVAANTSTAPSTPAPTGMRPEPS